MARKAKLPGKIIGEMNGFPVRRLSVGDLKDAEYNPRKQERDSFEGLRKSVATFGMVQAVVWNKRTQRVVGGHKRKKTLSPKSMTDVIEVDLDETMEKALNLSLNNPHIQGDFTSQLGTILEELEKKIPDLAADLLIDDLNVDFDEAISLVIDPGGVDEVNLETDKKPQTDDLTPPTGSRNHSMGWKLEIVFDNQESRDKALKSIRAVDEGEGLSEKLQALIAAYEDGY